jgi:hypothetical protein
MNDEWGFSKKVMMDDDEGFLMMIDDACMHVWTWMKLLR